MSDDTPHVGKHKPKDCEICKAKHVEKLIERANEMNGRGIAALDRDRSAYCDRMCSNFYILT